MSDVGLALWVAGSRFLETVEYADAPAVESLLKVQMLAPEQSSLVRGAAFGDGGLTDDWAPIVAMTWPVAHFDPAGLVRLYDPSVVQVHTKLVDLDQSGMTLLAVVRTEPGAGRTLELVESIVREVEGTMGRPLPLDYVGALFGEAVSPGAIGINYGTGLVIEPRFDVADGGEEAEQLRWVLAHEVAHYWWNGNENWIDEGCPSSWRRPLMVIRAVVIILCCVSRARRLVLYRNCRWNPGIRSVVIIRWDSGCSSVCTGRWVRTGFTSRQAAVRRQPVRRGVEEPVWSASGSCRGA